MINLKRLLGTNFAKHKQLVLNSCNEKVAKNGAVASQMQEFQLFSLDYLSDVNLTVQYFNEKEDQGFSRNAKNLFNLIILHDPLINKIILTMQENIIADTDPQNTESSQLQAFYDEHELNFLSDTTSQKGPSGMMSNAEIMNQVIHEDIKRIVDEMRRFRVDSYDAPVSAKSALMAKSALSRRWVDFYHKLLNMGILGLYN